MISIVTLKVNEQEFTIDLSKHKRKGLNNVIKSVTKELKPQLKSKMTTESLHTCLYKQVHDLLTQHP